MNSWCRVTATLFIVSIIAGCAAPARMGMVKDSQTGLQIGSKIEKNLFVDSSQFLNRSIKVSTRNASGDQAYQLAAFSNDFNAALARKGYIPTQADSFGIKLDINVLYSGQIQTNMAYQFAFLGGTAAGIAGARTNTLYGTGAGMLAGATIGSIIGSYVTDNTYILVAEVSIGISDSVGTSGGDNKVISFSSSSKLQEERLVSNYTPFREVIRTKVAVYAGGRNTSQQQISDQVRQRLVTIVCDSI